MFIASGVCMGIRTKTIVPRDKTKDPFDQYFLGLAVGKQGGYEGETEILDFRLTRDDLDAGNDEKFFKMKGKRCHVPFFVSAAASNGRAFVNYIISGEVIPADKV